MRERELRSVLLIKAIEESDPQGELIPMADRARATREAQRSAGEAQRSAGQATDDTALASPGSARLPARAERVLAQRAEMLTQQLARRFPVLDSVAAMGSVPSWLAWLLLALSAALGFALSALDGSRRINILAFPLLGLIAWNVAVYGFLLVASLRGRRATPSGPWLALRRLARKAAPYNTALAEALRRFTGEWSQAMAPVVAARATRWFHVCAAMVGAGLILGLYVRGIALRYDAGWESTFLSAGQARGVIAFLYAPASALTGVPLPDVARLEAMRWDAGRSGENAAPWIHLLAATTLLWVVLPRLALALLSSTKAWTRARDLALPADAVAYFRRSFAGAEDLVGRGESVVLAYAYAPSTNALAMLRSVLSTEFGGVVAGGQHAMVPYGDEDAFLPQLASRVGPATEVLVVLFSVASTPEEENHGTFLSGIRDWLTRSGATVRLVIAIDEAPYLQQPAARLEERRGVWRAFVGAHGLEPFFVNLGSA